MKPRGKLANNLNVMYRKISSSNLSSKMRVPGSFRNQEPPFSCFSRAIYGVSVAKVVSSTVLLRNNSVLTPISASVSLVQMSETIWKRWPTSWPNQNIVTLHWFFKFCFDIRQLGFVTGPRKEAEGKGQLCKCSHLKGSFWFSTALMRLKNSLGYLVWLLGSTESRKSVKDLTNKHLRLLVLFPFF